MSLLRYKQKLLPYGNAMGGDGGGSSAPAPAQPTNTTVQNTNIPEYARPYVETMLGTAQQQIFNYDSNGNVTSMKPYTPYSNNPTDYVAGFSPLQQQAQSNVANMQTPQQYQDASQMAGAGALGSFGLAGQEAQTGRNLAQASTNPAVVGAYMNPYLQNALAPSQQLLNQQYGMQSAAQQGAATQAGAFGGSRNALQQGLNEQNRMLAQNQLVGNAYQNAFGQAQNQMNTVSQQGLAGQQAAMQGLGQGISGAGTLGSLGGQQTQAALGINAAQQASGAAQQAQQQNIINQQVQNYATAQQYPMMQLANMSNLLRGLPMQSATTQTYQAAPSAVSQLGGLGATAIGAYGAAGGFKGAKGGLPKDFEKVKKFDVGGAVEADLENMDIPHLIQEAKTSPSATVRQEAIRILTEKQAEAAMAKGVGAAPSGMQMAGGGIVAFEEGGGVKAAQAKRDAALSVISTNMPDLPADYKGTLSDYLKDPENAKAYTENEKNREIARQAIISSFPIPTVKRDILNPSASMQQVPTTTAAPASTYKSGPTFDPTAGGNPAVTNLNKPNINVPPQVGVPPQSSVPGSYEAEIKKRLGVMDEGLGNTKAQADLDALRKEIGESKNDKLWQALMMGGLKTMGGRSPWAGVNIGEGGAEGVKSYAEASKGEREDKKLLVAQQSALDQAEYARKTGNLNALIAAQTRLDQIKQHRESLGAQYASIAASKEAQIDANMRKAYSDAYIKAYAANGGDDALATRAATAAMQMGTPANTPVGAPKAGDIIQGYKFKGGNPNDKSNWEKA